MPTLVDDAATGGASADVTMAEESPAQPTAPSSGKGKSGKRRALSPPPDAAATANQAIAAANLAAAVQMAASLQLNGLLSLLTQSSTPGAAAAADPTVLQTTAAPKANSSWQIPTPEQARQAALKAVADIPPFVHLSKTDSAPQLKIMDDRLTLKGGMRGYRMSRATHGVSQGFYYFEVLVLDPPSIQEVVQSLPPNARLGATLQKQIQEALEYDKRQKNNPESQTAATAATDADTTTNANEQNTTDLKQPSKPGRKRKAESELTPPGPPQVGGHLRIGWSMRTGDLQAPVGYDKWSFGFRNLMGSKIHQSRRDDTWGGESWGPGDVVGFAIFLEPSTNTAAATAAASGNNPSNAPAGNATAPAPSSSGNEIRFFKNGAAMGQFVITKGKREGGAAFDEEIQPGTYYPAISSYLGGSVQVNFGPHFIYPPRKLPHGMSGKLQPISSLQPPPLTESELLARLKKKNIFTKMAKESPETKMNAFREAALEENKVLQEAYKQHRYKHLQFVLEARKARNLNTTDLQQELEGLKERNEEVAPLGDEPNDAITTKPKEEATPAADAGEAVSKESAVQETKKTEVLELAVEETKKIEESSAMDTS